MLFGIIPLALAALIVCGTLAKHSAERRAAAAELAAQELAAAAKKRQEQEQRRAAQEKAEQQAAARKAAQEAKQAAQEQKRQERSARAAEAHALKVARAAELAELAERRLQAEKELAALHETPAQAQPAQAQPAAEQPAETPENHSEPEQAQPAAQVFTLDQFTQAAAPAPQPFKGHTVAFTGRLTISGMTRAQAIEKVKQAGGHAYKEMTSFTTLLVVGDKPGMKKLDKADAWISQVKKITEQQFLDMLAA